NGAVLPIARDSTQPAIVVERAEVDDLLVAAAEPPRAAARREQHLLVGVLLALVVHGTRRLEVEGGDAPAQAKLDAELLGSLPDGALLAPAPQLLRQRRPLVRRMRLGADERHDRFGVAFADRLGGLGTGHPAADDQIARSLHVLDPSQRGDLRTCALR